ncbi:hypothetical protein RhiLY_12125 [Ceratobasidium sp. AG-Ba]|nr:hypothetical protein RhiLY_12125 [Ceratobasidium sp. AG-Ba]
MAIIGLDPVAGGLLGASKGPVQGPPPLQQRWIYASDSVTNNPNSSPSQDSEQETRPLDEGVPAIPSAQAEPTSVAPSPRRSPLSLIARFIGWLLTCWLFIKLLLTGRPEPSPKPKAKRGAQPPTATPSVLLGPLTELAIATPEGLKAYKCNLNRSGFAEHRSRPMSQDEEDSDNSCSSSCSSPVESHGVRYESIKRDTAMILRHIRQLGFHETVCGDRSISTQPLEYQLANYLSRPPDDPLVPQIRWLVLTGHNSNKYGFKIDGRVNCKWRDLRKILGNLPPRIVTVVVLACCQAEAVMSELVDGPEIPGLILIASSERNEVSRADTLRGDYFLEALLTVLEAKSSGQTAHTWESLLGEISGPIHNNRSVSDPRLWRTNEVLV